MSKSVFLLIVEPTMGGSGEKYDFKTAPQPCLKTAPPPCFTILQMVIASCDAAVRIDNNGLVLSLCIAVSVH